MIFPLGLAFSFAIQVTHSKLKEKLKTLLEFYCQNKKKTDND
jgi:hypothetical protein